MLKSSVKSAPKKNIPIKKNPRYENFEPIVDTGQSLSRYLKRLSERATNYKFQENEIFQRMKASTLATFILQVCLCSNVLIERDKKSMTIVSNSVAPKITNQVAESKRNGLLNEFLHTEEETDAGSNWIITDDDPPLLLLDVRDRECFEKCHILGAAHYPHAAIKRGTVPADIFKYKNKEDRFIVFYDEDETLAQTVATFYAQREFCNVYILSGGLKVLAERFPCVLVGQIPASCIKKTVQTKPKAKLIQDKIELVSKPMQSPEMFDLNALRLLLDTMSTTSN
ncbi:hypothetical protein O9G_002779 [Rozella allomycis CSF55]|uniref:Rhodanese domain-containing protein n=1 Tax=Rozella allomycis (strain CSF55) TaxID=988480 RepID=A0A075AQN5_ROZAC|nr:hypothetical protein O9G_002779 [Rozella allomycis CSF55]|eukprot:EPZ30902.1 hypothetical protein O9G_002779 [Rozella allomycis CSF55]